MPRYKIEKGTQYGYLFALDEPKNEKGQYPFKRKLCGTKCYKIARVVATGHTKSCGCMPRGGDKRIQTRAGRERTSCALHPCTTCRKAVCYSKGEECKTCYDKSLFDLVGVVPKNWEFNKLYGGVSVVTKTVFGAGRVGSL